MTKSVLLDIDTPSILLLGSAGMLVLAVGLVVFIVFHQRKVIRYQMQLQKMEEEQQKILLNASIRWQEEERQRIAADLHDDAGPLLATARLYLNENLIHQEVSVQLQSIFNAKQIIDDTIQLIRNISHSLMPPTLKNFGLESAVNDLFQKSEYSFRYFAPAIADFLYDNICFSARDAEAEARFLCFCAT